MISNRNSPIQDDYLEKYLTDDVADVRKLNPTATLDAEAAYKGTDFVVIVASTKQDSNTQHFGTSAVETVTKLVMQYNSNTIMGIKSTIPITFTVSIREKTGSKNSMFSPEFLREYKALYDNVCPAKSVA